MKIKINTKDYTYVESIKFNNIDFISTYNHNYFYSKNNGDLILEEGDDNQTCYYYRIEKNKHSFIENYLGYSEDKYGFGIFDMDYDGYPKRNEQNVVELNSNLS